MSEQTELAIKGTGGTLYAVVFALPDAEFIMHDGPAMSCNCAGTPYETFSWQAAFDDEKSKASGVEKVIDAARQHLLEIVQHKDLRAIEWRLRPTLEFFEGAVRVRYRMITHWHGELPQNLLSAVRESAEPRMVA